MSLTFDLLLQVVAIVDVQASVVMEVSELDFVESLHEHGITARFITTAYADTIMVRRCGVLLVVALVLLL